MPDVTISDLAAASIVNTTDVLPISNGTQTLRATVSQLRGSSAGAITGSIILWPLNSAPSGYLICDGSAISRTTYSALFAVLGTAYGAGDGSTTFKLPDYRGQFLRGWDNGAGVDPDRASRTNRGDGTTGDNVGTKQVDAFKSHTHPVPGGSGGGATVARGEIGLQYFFNTYPTGGNETRPTNVYINYCIKT